MNENEFWIWLAGFIDGEGCLGMYKTDDTSFQIKIEIPNTNKECLELIKSCANINNIIHPKKQQKENHKIVYVLVVSSRAKCLEILTKINPYLIVKKHQANILIDYLTNTKSHHRTTINRNDVKTAIQNLNKRGSERGSEHIGSA